MQDETYRTLNEHPEPEPADHNRPLTYQLMSTQTDHELRAIEWILTLLDPLPHDTQVRALTYIQDRIEFDRTHTAPSVHPVERREVAQAIAESDGRDWSVMSAVDRSPYFRRADVLTTSGLTVIRSVR